MERPPPPPSRYNAQQQFRINNTKQKKKEKKPLLKFYWLTSQQAIYFFLFFFPIFFLRPSNQDSRWYDSLSYCLTVDQILFLIFWSTRRDLCHPASLSIIIYLPSKSTREREREKKGIGFLWGDFLTQEFHFHLSSFRFSCEEIEGDMRVDGFLFTRSLIHTTVNPGQLRDTPLVHRSQPRKSIKKNKKENSS